MPRYSATLSGKSFRALADKIRAYRDDLEEKCKVFAVTVAQHGYDVIRAELLTHPNGVGNTVGGMTLNAEDEGQTYICKIRVTSDAILFLEFGTGTVGRDSSAYHPLAGEMGMGPGTFPGKGHWDDPKGWFYYDSDKGGRKFHTYGQPASMPMYQGYKAMQEEFMKIAKEVFQW